MCLCVSFVVRCVDGCDDGVWGRYFDVMCTRLSFCVCVVRLCVLGSNHGGNVGWLGFEFWFGVRWVGIGGVLWDWYVLVGCGYVGFVVGYVDSCSGGVWWRCLDVLCPGCVCVVCGCVSLLRALGVM